MFPRSAIPEDIGRRIRAVRQKQCLSQDGVALLAGLRRETVWRIEAGGTPSSHAVFAIERALDLSSPHFVKAWQDPADPRGPSLGPRIRMRRRELKLSLIKVANAAGVSEPTLSRFERELVTCGAIVNEVPDEHGLLRAKISNAGLAHVLGFSGVDELQAYCDANATDTTSAARR